MPDREKVKRGLECHRKGVYEFCKQCPYHYDGCEATLCSDALALLKDQEARVMTLEELNLSATERIRRPTMDDFDAEAFVKALGSFGDLFESLGNFIREFTEILSTLIDQYEDPEGEDQEDENSDSGQLEPCPFCGKSVATLSNAKELEDCCNFEDDDVCPDCMDWSGGCGFHTVVCGVTDGGCGAATGYFPTKSEAIAAWNRRTKEDADADGS